MLAEILQFQAWLVHREYSQATIQKYTYALTRFFRFARRFLLPVRWICVFLALSGKY